MRGPAPQAVILASDTGARLYPLNGPATPKALLPVGNRPLLSFPLAMIEHSGTRHVLVVCSGDETASRVHAWIAKHYEGDLHLEVRAIAEGLGSADALRAVADSLVADAVAVLSCDLVSDVPLGAVLAAHTVRGAAATSLLAPRRGLASAECKPGKAPKNVDFVGLDAAGRTLLFFAASPDARRDIGLPLPALRRAGAVTLRTDVSDAHCYVFDRVALLAALEARPGASSLKQDVLPYMVRHQFDQPATRLETLRSDSLKLQAALDGGLSTSVRDFVADMSHAYRGGAGSARNGGAGSGGGSGQAAVHGGGGVGTYMAGADRFCARANTPHNYGEINRDVATPALATRLLGPATNPRHDNWMEPPKRLGSKATVGAGCVIAGGADIGDKASVKRSVMGPGCVVGANARVINSVLMAGVVVGEGAHVQGSILCDGVRVGAHAILRDCQVGAGYTVTEQTDHRSEALAYTAKAAAGVGTPVSAVGSPRSESSSG